MFAFKNFGKKKIIPFKIKNTANPNPKHAKIVIPTLEMFKKFICVKESNTQEK